MASITKSGPMIELDEAQCWHRLAENQVGRLAVIDDRGPVVFPVNYAVDGRSIVFRTNEGTKLDAALEGQSAAFEVDEIHRRQHTGWSVLVRGALREVEGYEDVKRVRELQLTPFAAGDRERFVRLTPSTVTGYDIGVPPERHPSEETAPEVGNVWHGQDGSDLLG